ncbi:MAG: PAS domain-containing protein [Verrucomicrobiota bacterium]
MDSVKTDASAANVCQVEPATLLEALLANSLDLIYFKDKQSRLIRYSLSFSMHFGLSKPDALVGKTDFDCYPADIAQPLFDEEQKIIRTGQPLIGKLEQGVRCDGRKTWFLTTKMPWRDAQGEIIGTYGVSKDVTAMKKVEADLAETSSLLEALLENSPDYIYFKDRESRFVRYSNSLAKLFDADSKQLKGKSDFDFFTEEHARPAFEDEQAIIRTGQPMIGKPERETYSDGRITWALTTKMPWRNARGEIIGTFGISKDVTALKRIEAELAEASSLLDTLLENSPDCIYFKDRDSKFVRYSKSMAQLFKVDYPDLKGKSDFDFFTEEHARPAYEDEQEIMRSGKPMIGKPERETHPDGRTTWALTTKMPWRDTQGNIIGTFGISKDVTVIKEAEAKVEQLHKELLSASRQAGMAEVATSVLHNVGNVLNSVNVGANLVADRLRNSRIHQFTRVAGLLREHQADLVNYLSSDPKGRQIPEFLFELSKALLKENEGMVEELGRLNGNIDHIKEIVAMQQNYAMVSGVTEKVRIVDLVEDALRMNAGALSRHDVQLVREYQDSLPEIVVDKHKVLQILVNLIRNAKYACDDSGREEKRLTMRIGRAGERVAIEVLDNGVGIPAENLNRIFNHGFTTRKEGHGFGLHSGANAAKEIGGSLSAHSDGPGSGARFTLTLPLQPPVDH